MCKRVFVALFVMFLTVMCCRAQAQANLIVPEMREYRVTPMIHTNLLYDAALMPDLGIEVAFGRHYSLLFEYAMAWWSSSSDLSWCYRLAHGTVEGRYWLRGWNRSETAQPTGHFFGLYASMGMYDLEFHGDGVQSMPTPFSMGVSYGYAFRLNRQFTLQCGLGVGFLQTRYHRYIHNPQVQTLDATRRADRLWVGPTRAMVSLVWTPDFSFKTRIPCWRKEVAQ